MRYIPYMLVSRVIVVDLGYHEETSQWDWELSVGGAEARELGVRGRTSPWPLALVQEGEVWPSPGVHLLSLTGIRSDAAGLQIRHAQGSPRCQEPGHLMLGCDSSADPPPKHLKASQ